MSIATIEILKESYESNDLRLRHAVRDHFGQSHSGGAFNEQQAQRYLDQMKNQLLAHQLGKGVRPWSLVDMSKKLDPKQPWVGIEFETGYANRDAYQNIVNFVWDSFPLSAIDREGCGAFPCEITFSPVNFDDFVSDAYNMDLLYRHMEKNKIKKSGNGHMAVGTHCNISTPAFRALCGKGNEWSDGTGATAARRIVELMNRAIQQLSAENRKRFFGRNPYGLFYLRGNEYGRWLEGKLFNSTGDIQQWRVYKEVIAKFCEIVEHIAGLMMKKELPLLYKKTSDGSLHRDRPNYEYVNGRAVAPVVEVLTIGNLAALLSGKTPVKQMQLLHV